MDKTNEELLELVAVQTRKIDEMNSRMRALINEKAEAEVRAYALTDLHVVQSAAESVGHGGNAGTPVVIGTIPAQSGAPAAPAALSDGE